MSKFFGIDFSSKDSEGVVFFIVRAIILGLFFYFVPKDYIKIGTPIYGICLCLLIVSSVIYFLYFDKLNFKYKLILEIVSAILIIYIGRQFESKFPQLTYWTLLGFSSILVPIYFYRESKDKILIDYDMFYIRNEKNYKSYVFSILALISLLFFLYVFINETTEIVLVLVLVSYFLLFKSFQASELSIKVEEDWIYIDSYKNKYLLTELAEFRVHSGQIEFIDRNSIILKCKSFDLDKSNAEFLSNYIKKSRFVNPNLKVEILF